MDSFHSFSQFSDPLLSEYQMYSESDIFSSPLDGFYSSPSPRYSPDYMSSELSDSPLSGFQSQIGLDAFPSMGSQSDLVHNSFSTYAREDQLSYFGNRALSLSYSSVSSPLDLGPMPEIPLRNFTASPMHLIACSIQSATSLTTPDDSDADAEGESDDSSADEYVPSPSPPPHRLPLISKRRTSVNPVFTLHPSRKTISSTSKSVRQAPYLHHRRHDSSSSSRTSSTSPASSVSDFEQTVPESEILEPKLHFTASRIQQVQSVGSFQPGKGARPWHCPVPSCKWVQTNKRAPDLARHIQSHNSKGWACCGIPQSQWDEHPELEGRQIYRWKGMLWKGGCFKVIGRSDAFRRHLKNNREGCVGHTTGDCMELARTSKAEEDARLPHHRGIMNTHLPSYRY